MKLYDWFKVLIYIYYGYLRGHYYIHYLLNMNLLMMIILRYL